MSEQWKEVTFSDIEWLAIIGRKSVKWVEEHKWMLIETRAQTFGAAFEQNQKGLHSPGGSWSNFLLYHSQVGGIGWNWNYSFHEINFYAVVRHSLMAGNSENKRSVGGRDQKAFWLRHCLYGHVHFQYCTVSCTNPFIISLTSSFKRVLWSRNAWVSDLSVFLPFPRGEAF